MWDNLSIVIEPDGDEPWALSLAERLGVRLYRRAEEKTADALFLRFSRDGLSLLGQGQSLRGDFLRMLPRLKPNNLNGELLVRASGIRSLSGIPCAVDATAGLGEDSFLLAAAGFSVRLFEYDPVIAALLEDALRRAKADPALAGIAARMTLSEGDSIPALHALPEPPDLILLDPMFPARTKSAEVKKKFRLLHRLEQPCANEEALFRAALSARPRRIVIKRPLKGPYLAGIRPAFSLSGKAIRYDCLHFPGGGKQTL